MTGSPGNATHVTRSVRTRPSPARPEDARSHNRAQVLQALYRGKGLSRADLARQLGLTRVTVSDVVSDLLDQGLVAELGVRTGSRPGKPATLLDINRAGFNVIGVDLSSSQTFTGAVTDLSGEIIARDGLDITGVTGDGAVEAAGRLIENLVAKAQQPILGVGVGSPGLINDEGEVLSAPGLDWSHVLLQEILRERIGLPVLVANDANVAALAERTFGGGSDDLIVVRIGRGVGSGLVVGGEPVRGARWAAGEIGHVVVGTDHHAPCPCGKSGCLETWLGAPRIRSKLAEAANPAEQDAILTQAGTRLGIALAPVIGALNLDEVVVAGPDDVLGDAFMDGLTSTLSQRTMEELHGDLTVRATSLATDIVVLGAIVTVLTTQLGVS